MLKGVTGLGKVSMTKMEEEEDMDPAKYHTLEDGKDDFSNPSLTDKEKQSRIWTKDGAKLVDKSTNETTSSEPEVDTSTKVKAAVFVDNEEH